MRQLVKAIISLIGIGLSCLTLSHFTPANADNALPVAKAQLKLTACETPRPIICQQTYSPVCAVFSKPKNKLKTFRNGCLACQNQDVQGFEQGKCLKDIKH